MENSATVSKKSGNLLYLFYSYCNTFVIHDVHGEIGLVNAHLFDILRAISSRKVGNFFSLYIE